MAVVAVIFLYLFFDQDKGVKRAREVLPSPVAQSELSPEPSVEVTQSVKEIPTEHNLAVPFTPQAPHGNWDEIHEDTCEEASILMVGRYYQNRSFESADDADREMLKMIDWQNENFGYFQSTNAEQTLEMMEEFFDIKGEIVTNPTEEEIKSYIFNNKLVIVPAAGRELGNPFFRQPGPLYHMLVIRGYTESQFITNDPGTKRGENYPYDVNVILDSNRDWNGGNVENGEKVMIVVGQKQMTNF